MLFKGAELPSFGNVPIFKSNESGLEAKFNVTLN